MVTVYEQRIEKKQKDSHTSTLHKILSKLTAWSIDEMHAWSQYMKQKDRKKS